jgi:flavorubredoxin
MQDNEVLDLGRHRLRFLVTPHVPHAWDAILLYEEATGTLFTSDLFTQSGKSGPVTKSDVVGLAVETLKKYPDYLPVGQHTARVFDRLEALNPTILAGHHSPTFTGNAVQALRDLRQALFTSLTKAPA